MKALLDKFLNLMVEKKGSDLHLKASSQVRMRINGLLKIMSKGKLKPEQVEGIVRAITNDEMMKKLKSHKSLDFTYVLDENSRFRVNVFYQMNGLSVVMRVIPVKIPTIDELKLPEVIKSFADIQRGLVLVTGVTGSGKSTTLAAILNRINETYEKHIITLEDPIEFVHPDKKCLINQRSIGQDSNSFADALPAALREDPDIILVGEMRDTETIDLALHAANTGHLVFSTLHTLDAKETINRVVGMFPEAEQNRIRLSLASVIQGIVSQRLVRTTEGGRRAVTEILVRTARIEELIAEGVALHLSIAGERYPGNPSSLSEQEVEKLKKVEGITLLGHIQDILPEIQDADVVVLPSYLEGTPKSLLEAAACGKPIIATDIPGCRGLVQPGVNGYLCETRSKESLKKSIEMFIERPELWESYGKASREIVESDFSEDVVIRKTLQLYESQLRAFTLKKGNCKIGLRRD